MLVLFSLSLVDDYVIIYMMLIIFNTHFYAAI